MQPFFPHEPCDSGSDLILIIAHTDDTGLDLFENAQEINFFSSENRSINYSKSTNELPPLILRNNRTSSFPSAHCLVPSDHNNKLGTRTPGLLGFLKKSEMP
jgi:hypothetical protein